VKVKLGDVIQLNPSEKLPKGGIARKVAMDNLDPYAREISGFDFDEYKGGTKFRNEDTLLARITPCLENGKTAYVDILEKDEVAFGSTEYFVLRAKKELISPLYLYYLSVSSNFRTVAIKSMTGTSGRQRVQREAILNYEFDLPSLEEQEKIASRIGYLDDKKTLNDKINDNLLELITLIWSRYSQNISNKVPLKKIAKDIVTGKTPSTKIKANYGSDIPFVKIPDMHNKVFIDETLQSLSLLGADSQKNKYLPANSIMVSCIGTPGLVSLTGSIAQTNQQINSLVLDEKFIYWVFLELRSLSNKIGNLGSGGTTIKNLNKSDFSKLEVVVPDNDILLDKFNSIAKPIFESIHTNSFETNKLNQLKKRLLHKFF